MRPVLLLLLVFAPITVMAQSLPEWYRVYTFDESTIEMNTSLVTRPDRDITRLRFRWSFDQPESLDGKPELKYQSQLEVMEFNCSKKQYRSYHLTFLDKAGNIVHIRDVPDKWRPVISGSMTEKLFVPGCALTKRNTTFGTRSPEAVQLERVTRYAYDLAQQLDQAKDFKIVIDRFFVSGYLNGYLHDRRTNWFLNLSRNTATKISRQELQRFYIAIMNVGYLNTLYVVSQFSSDPASIEKLLPPNVLQLLNNHHYRTKYKTLEGNYDFLGETIDDVERLRSYTDLLEKIGSLMRKHVKTLRAEQTPKWKAMLEHWDLYQPKPRVCATNCLGLPKDTKIFEVRVPVFQLQVAEIRGELKVISAISRF